MQQDVTSMDQQASTGTTGIFEYVPKGPRIICGRGSETRLAQELEKIGAERSLVVCGRRVAQSGWLQSLRKDLGAKCAGVFGRVEPHTPIEGLREGAAEARRVSADCFVAIGGGSVQDAAKLIALMLAEGEDIDKYRIRWVDRELHIPNPGKPKLPVIGIPTTLSAAEILGAAAYVSGDKRYVIVDPAICPRAVLYDPELAVTTPVDIFLGTGMNAIAHCVESFYSRKAQPISAALGLGALRLLMESLGTCVKDPQDLQAREQALVGACMSGLSYSNTWNGIAHSLSQALGARYRVSHGFVNAIVLPHAMRFNFPATKEKQHMIARAMADVPPFRGSSSGSVDASEMMARFNAHLGLPPRLRDLGVPNSELSVVAEEAFEVWHTYFNPRRVNSPEELLGVLQEAW